MKMELDHETICMTSYSDLDPAAPARITVDAEDSRLDWIMVTGASCSHGPCYL